MGQLFLSSQNYIIERQEILVLEQNTLPITMKLSYIITRLISSTLNH